MKYFLTIIFISSFFVNTGATQTGQRLADTLRARHGIPELAFAVVKADTIMEMSVTGQHVIGSADAMPAASKDDLFHLGSNTKAITSFIAASLVEKGLLKWDSRFFDLFPEAKKKSNSAYHAITLQDLLSHKARVRAFTSGIEYQSLPEFSGSVQQKRSDFAFHVLTLSPAQPAKGIPYVYSNAGYSIAAQMLEKVSGESWEELVTEIIGEKAGLRFSFGWPNRKDSAQPWGHWMEDGRLRALPPDHSYDLRLVEPAGDISMPLPDYARFIQMNLQGLAGKDNMLKASTYEFLHYGLEGYSMGWTNFTKNGRRMSDHAGSAGTFYCYTLLDKKDGMAYIIMTNIGSGQAQEGVFGLLENLMRKYGSLEN